jgi:hypothetical protein
MDVCTGPEDLIRIESFGTASSDLLETAVKGRSKYKHESHHQLMNSYHKRMYDLHENLELDDMDDRALRGTEGMSMTISSSCLK